MILVVSVHCLWRCTLCVIAASDGFLACVGVVGWGYGVGWGLRGGGVGRRVIHVQDKWMAAGMGFVRD